jgi:hypothetical protein
VTRAERLATVDRLLSALCDICGELADQDPSDIGPEFNVPVGARLCHKHYTRWCHTRLDVMWQDFVENHGNTDGLD